MAFMIESEADPDAGTGSGFGRIVLVLAGVSSLIAILITAVYVYPTFLTLMMVQS
jgi:hypothetical protein